ncbi:MAG TPA: KH domain-containing protein [Candidatus Babeliales bacterium]|nr:KH domain-containing protein [Candidatus Dependentiae bacterium]HEX2977755.1 KH domain-containing protein [Candidatus Babeliales bacterium]
MLKQLIEHVVSKLVDKPEVVKVEVFHEDARVLIELKVHEDDFKRVIGKEGRVIKAIRSVAQVITPEGKEVVVDVVQ